MTSAMSPYFEFLSPLRMMKAPGLRPRASFSASTTFPVISAVCPFSSWRKVFPSSFTTTVMMFDSGTLISELE
jgi:hypothetical protein